MSKRQIESNYRQAKGYLTKVRNQGTNPVEGVRVIANDYGLKGRVVVTEDELLPGEDNPKFFQSDGWGSDNWMTYLKPNKGERERMIRSSKVEIGGDGTIIAYGNSVDILTFEPRT